MGSVTQRVHLGLSMLAYAGLSGEPARRVQALHELLAGWLTRLPETREHEIIWGPASFRVWWPASAPALSVFVTRAHARAGGGEGAPCHVVVRGGGPIAVWDHHLESLAYLEQEPWVWAQDAGSLAPAVCAGVLRQLEVIRELTPEEQLPGAGRDLAEFLAERVAAAQGDCKLPINVVGHGLGGALASMVALWLSDIQGQTRTREIAWDPERGAKVHCTAFASPAVGNSDFATYISERLGAELGLIHNNLDPITSLYDPHSMAELDELYQPDLELTPMICAVINALRDELERHGVEYEQPPAQLLVGRINPSLPPSFVAQAEYQHLHAYADLLGIDIDIDAIFDRPSGTDDGPIAQ